MLLIFLVFLDDEINAASAFPNKRMRPVITNCEVRHKLHSKSSSNIIFLKKRIINKMENTLLVGYTSLILLLIIMQSLSISDAIKWHLSSSSEL